MAVYGQVPQDNQTALTILPKMHVMQMGGTNLMSTAGCQVCLASGLLFTLPELLLPIRPPQHCACSRWSGSRAKFDVGLECAAGRGGALGEVVEGCLRALLLDGVQGKYGCELPKVHMSTPLF